ncbi:hypothetical protein DQ238_01215 [Geodermatophilus sp. TF02-6]|uniref:helix-turn-helix domain-containing protein n=1 Tax=Geodermatophilus sp. TF02-6 TaxID=2250575 RepID=UPI000DE94399|nr:helix-turn-helix transcriptional regulator [Geodermatophilus sp. TF02-6]RBY83726.1 hypothetical protein DQ238_01215 [Geodermatophilus sp. TF02-6]
MTGVDTQAEDREAQLGRRLRELRTGAGWSQERLAEAMRAAGFGWRPNTVTKTEQAQRTLKATEAAVVAQALDIEVAALLVIEPGAVHVRIGDPHQDPPVLTPEQAAAEVARLRERIERVAAALLPDEEV